MTGNPRTTAFDSLRSTAFFILFLFLLTPAVGFQVLGIPGVLVVLLVVIAPETSEFLFSGGLDLCRSSFIRIKESLRALFSILAHSLSGNSSTPSSDTTTPSQTSDSSEGQRS